MTYLDLLNGFHDLLMRSQVSKNGQLLYHTLLMINNKSSWSDWFQRTNVSLYAMMGMSEKGLIEARKELKELGIIDYIPSRKKGQVTKYSVLHCKIYGSKYSLNDSENDSLSDSQNAVETTGETTDIKRLKTKTKTKTDKKTTDVVQKKFVPPTVEAVRGYCQERNNGIDPQRFVDFYSAKGWMLGKNKMKDWRACVRTWERRQEGEGHGKRNTAADDGVCKQLAREGNVSEFAGWD